jgi:hypothetical protein
MLTQHTVQLSITQKQGIITCIPKGDKPRPPIYLPGMKPVWSLLIRIGRTDLIRSAIQLEASLYTVFRRLIGLQFFINGENTRLIYDILHFTKEQDIPLGILLLIDFEKAFDSISWMFIESVLRLQLLKTVVSQTSSLFKETVDKNW